MKKTTYVSVFALLMFFSCEKQADPSALSISADKNILYKENVAMVDARARAVDPAHFVKELVIADFSKEGVVGDAFVFEDVAFIDNGQGFDTKAGDGVYTAVTKSPYNDRVRVGSLTGAEPKSLGEGALIDPAFKKATELSDYQSKYIQKLPSESNARPAVRVVVCNVEWGSGCRATQWGWCENCCVVYSCHYEYW